MTRFRWPSVAALLALALCACDVGAQPDSEEQGPLPARGPLFKRAYCAFQWGLHWDSQWGADVRGGEQRGNILNSVVQLGIALSTEGLGLWDGGRFAVSALRVDGSDISANLAGDLQGVNNLAAPQQTQVYEAWYRQRWTDPGLTLRAGLIDLNHDFATTDTASNLVNASFGLTPTLALNVPASIYPKLGLGLTAAWEQGPWTLRAGAFQGDPAAGVTGHGALGIAEAAYERPRVVPIRYKFGFWYHSDPGIPGLSGDAGSYAIVETQLYRKGPQQLGGFLQLARAGRSGNMVRNYLGLGFNVVAPWGSRTRDSWSLGMARAGLANASATAETAYELTYVFALRPYMFLQPDLQYVTHPGGTTEIGNAFVTFLRFHAEFF